jgi:hypothetical protein
MEYFNVNYNAGDFIQNKQYREKKIKFVNDNNYLQEYDSQEHGLYEKANIFGFNEVEIQALLDAENVEEQEKNADNKSITKEKNDDVIANSITATAKEIPAVINDNELSVSKEKVNQIDDEDDANGNVTEEVESDDLKKLKQLLKHLLIIQYYKLPINQYRFIFDEPYQEEIIKEESFKEHLKKFDEEENIEVYDYEFIGKEGKELKIKYKGQLSREYKNNDIVINNSIEAVAEEIPVVVNDNEVKVTESKDKIKKEKKKKEEKVKRKRIDKDQQIIQNSIALANEEIPAVVNDAIDDDANDVIVLPAFEVTPVFKVINGKVYRLRKKPKVNYDISSEEEDGNKEKKEDEYVNRREDENEGKDESER